MDDIYDCEMPIDWEDPNDPSFLLLESRFKAYMTRPVKTDPDESTRVKGYNDNRDPCPFFDGGTYTTGYTATFDFQIHKRPDDGVFESQFPGYDKEKYEKMASLPGPEQKLEFYLCSSDGRRELATWMNDRSSEVFNWECAKGVEVWVEVKGVSGNIGAIVGFSGGRTG